jgi:Protein of unknown function (DUF2281)
MGYAELIHQRLQTMPQDKQAEVYDFVEFIATRSQASTAPTKPHEEWTDQEFSRLAMTQAMRGLENDPVEYQLADIKERWQ